ncbi:MAG: hypothetical protein EOM66_07065 [Clostridia bacterium]|nr:hypothetical protein [Clostridia bacterium]
MNKTKPMKGLFTRSDGLLIAGLLVLLAVLLLVFTKPRGGDLVRVYLDGALYAEAPLSENQVIVVEQPGGERNELVIEDGRVWMQSASCENQDCVHQSPLTAEGAELRPLGNWIICLPNRVSVELVQEGAE